MTVELSTFRFEPLRTRNELPLLPDREVVSDELVILAVEAVVCPTLRPEKKPPTPPVVGISDKLALVTVSEPPLSKTRLSSDTTGVASRLLSMMMSSPLSSAGPACAEPPPVVQLLPVQVSSVVPSQVMVAALTSIGVTSNAMPPNKLDRSNCMLNFISLFLKKVKQGA